MRGISCPACSFAAFSLCALGLTGVISCGGGGSSTTEASGQILDALVEGLQYSSGSVSGLTDVNGRFVYQAGSPVTFSIGDIVLGSVDGSTFISIADFVEGVRTHDEAVGVESEALNIVQFLQTIDADNDPTNGIHIDAATREAAAGQVMDFGLEGWDEDEEVNATLELLTTNPMVSEEQAVEHGKAWIAASRVGEYGGTWNLYSEGEEHEISFSIRNHGDIHVAMEGPDGWDADDVFVFSSAFAPYAVGEPKSGWAPDANGVFYTRDDQGEWFVDYWRFKTDTVLEFGGWLSLGLMVIGELQMLDTEVTVRGQWSFLAGSPDYKFGTFSGSHTRE